MTLEQLAALTAVVAGVVAAVSTYFRFFHRRLWTPRLDMEISGKIVRHGERSHLVTLLSVENISYVRVRVRQRGSGLDIYAHPIPEQTDYASSPSGKHLATFAVLEGHRWIEPAETIREERIVDLPLMDCVAFILKCRLIHPTLFRNRKKIATAIVRYHENEPARLKGEEPC